MSTGRRAAGVRISLLGGVRADDSAGRSLDVGPTKSRTLLAALALSTGRSVPVAHLIDAVWPDDPPRTAEKTLQSYIVRLRRALGHRTIVRDGAAYRLDLPADVVDVNRFRERLAEGDVDSALAQWHGPPLADLDAPALRPTVDGLTEQWLDAVEQSLSRRVDGDPAGAIGRLTELTATHPFRERLWELLMVALYRAGRQADALAAFQTARRHFDEHLGVEPGVGLRQLEARILSHDDRLLGEPPATTSPSVAAPPQRSTTGPAARPAHGAGRLIGRAADLDRLRTALERSPLVTLVGPGGVGKTRLAVAAADNGGGMGTAWFVSLAEVSSARDVARAAAAVTGAPEGSGRTVTDAVAAHLRARSGLLVLDNCEHVLDGAARLALAVAGGCPGVRILATSREPLAVGAEQVLPLPPLAASAGVELFTERARSASPTFGARVDRTDVETICARLDGLPLAIELAAARTATLTTAEVVARLDDRLRLLTGRRRDLDPRQRTLRAALQWSYDLLTPDQQVLFARTSVFAGPFDAAAAHHVAGEDGHDVIAVDDELAGLADRSLLAVDHGSRGHRYRMLETLRAFGAEALAESADADAVAARHARWCVEEGTRARALLEGPEEAVGAARVDELWPNLRTAFDRAVGSGDIDVADAIARPVASELAMRQRLEIGDWAERLLAVLPAGDPRAVHWLLWATQRHMEQGNRAALDDLVRRHGHGGHPLVRHAVDNVDGDGDALVASSRDAVTWLRAHGEHYLADWMEIVGVGAGLLRGGRLDEHDAFVAPLTARHRNGGPPTFVHWTLFMQGYAALFRGDYPAAEALLDEAAAVPVPPGTFSANRPAEARAAFRRGEQQRAVAVLHDHVVELLAMDNNMVASRLAAIEFINLTVALGRPADAARLLGHLRTTGPFGALAVDTVVADAVERIADDGDHRAAERHGATLDYSEALVTMRDALAALR